MKGLADSPVSETSPPAAPAPAEPEYRRQEGGTLVYGPFVRIMTVVIIAIVIAMVSLIYWRWVTVREPTSAAIILGDQTLDGAKIVVKGYGQEWKAALGADNNYVTPVLLEPGHYSITVTHKKQALVVQDFVVERLHGVQYDLPPAVQFIAPASTHDVQVAIDGDKGTHFTATLTADNRHHQTVYLPVGPYHATATDQGHVVSTEDFFVDHTKPVTVKVGQAQSGD